MDDKELFAKAAALPKVFGNDHWGKYRTILRDQILSGNPNEMLTWPTIVATMQVGPQRYVELAADYLFQDGEEIGRWSKAVIDPGLGDAVPFDYARRYVDGKPASHLVHQAYYVKRWEEHTGKKVNDLNFIVEFGGGYGAMAYVCRRLGFEGMYRIYDFPVVSLLQEYYLSNAGIHDVWLDSRPFSFDADLFISLWGITEAPLFDRAWVTEQPAAKHNMLTYINQWLDIDNSAWIEEHFDGEVQPLQLISPSLYLLLS